VIARVTECVAGTLARLPWPAAVIAGGSRWPGAMTEGSAPSSCTIPWCPPGAGRQVVLTTAAIEALDDAQLTPVLAHERARQRDHYLLVSLAASLAAAFPRVPRFPAGSGAGRQARRAAG